MSNPEKVSKVKKVFTPSPLQVSKKEGRNKWSDDTRSLTAITKYLQNEGRDGLNDLLALYEAKKENDKAKVTFTVEHVTNIANIVKVMTERQKFIVRDKKVTTERRKLFQLGTIQGCIGRMYKVKQAQ